jgi:hypothetical protein
MGRAARLPGWEAGLLDFVRAGAARSFEWGSWDCVMVAAGAVAAQTGVDFAEDFRGRYRTALGAGRVMKRAAAGLDDDDALRALVSERLGPPVVLARAHRGDVCRYEGALGVLMADHGLFAGPENGQSGWVRVPRRELEGWAWHLPFEDEA